MRGGGKAAAAPRPAVKERQQQATAPTTIRRYAIDRLLFASHALCHENESERKLDVLCAGPGQWQRPRAEGCATRVLMANELGQATYPL